ncbi:MAG: lysophospholipid acyltransferase family protein [Opitutaceae bacterium]
MKNRLLSSSLFVWFVTRLVSSYSRTFRLTVQNEQTWRDHLEQGGSVILCSWHQQFFSFVRHFRGYRHYRPGLMISRSTDGSLIAGVARGMGWITVRGSSSRGGLEAMRGMIQHIRKNRLGAHIVDGPRGPIGVIKKGIIHMARETDAVIVPVYATPTNAWSFRSWDRFFIPKPFSRVCIQFGDPFRLPPRDDDKCIEAERARLEATMRPRLYGSPCV